MFNLCAWCQVKFELNFRLTKCRIGHKCDWTVGKRIHFDNLHLAGTILAARALVPPTMPTKPAAYVHGIRKQLQAATRPLDLGAPENEALEFKFREPARFQHPATHNCDS